MIFGSCPYCDGTVVNAMPKVSPKFAKRECEHCGKTYWLRCSRIESYAMTEEDFLDKYVVDEKTKTITKKEKSQ